MGYRQKIYVDNHKYACLKDLNSTYDEIKGLYLIGNNKLVVKGFERCQNTCRIFCKRCNICWHQFTCSCLNKNIKKKFCEHIHAV